MEKQGNTEKLVFDFNTASNLEVWMVNLNGWYRVTSREFRSFNGKRKINNVDYIGPVYAYGTNRRINKLQYQKNKIIDHKWKPVIKKGI